MKLRLPKLRVPKLPGPKLRERGTAAAGAGLPGDSAPDAEAKPRPRLSLGWRSLGWFWGVLLVVMLSGAGVLQALGPKQTQPIQAAHLAKPMATPALAHTAMSFAPPPQPLGAAPVSGNWVIPPPDPALMEASTAFPGMMLPRRSAEGRQPMSVFARRFDPADHRPRVALLIDGLGLSQTDSAAAIAAMPGAVSFAVSPYTVQPDPMLSVIRAAGHEFLISIPMEPQGYPLNDEGSHALLTGAAPEQNAMNLEWALTRIQGYAGATGALDGMRGERYAAITDMLGLLEDELAVRGLFYIDPRPGAAVPANATGRGVDVVLDDPPLRADIEAKLARLEQVARDRGSALGLAGPPRPVTLERIVAWANGLSARGIALVPVSALVQPPAGIGVAKAGPVEGTTQ